MEGSGVIHQGAVSITAAKQHGRHLKRDLSITSNNQNNLDLRSQARLRQLAESTINEIGCALSTFFTPTDSVECLRSSCIFFFLCSDGNILDVSCRAMTSEQHWWIRNACCVCTCLVCGNTHYTTNKVSPSIEYNARALVTVPRQRWHAVKESVAILKPSNS